MKGFILALVLILGTAPVYACEEIGRVHGLTEVQKRTLIVECETARLDKAKSAANVPVTVSEKVESATAMLSPETMSQISTIAKTAGATVKEVAAELNVAVNDFIKTPVGLLTAGLAVWYVAGDTIEGVFSRVWDIFLAIVLFIITTAIGRSTLRSILRDEDETVTVTGWFGRTKVKTIKKYYTWKNYPNDCAPLVLTAIVMIVLYIICMSLVSN